MKVYLLVDHHENWDWRSDRVVAVYASKKRADAECNAATLTCPEDSCSTFEVYAHEVIPEASRVGE